MKKILNAIKKAGFTKLAFAGLAAVFAIFGVWSAFYAMLGIFIYVNFNTLYKYLMDIKL